MCAGEFPRFHQPKNSPAAQNELPSEANRPGRQKTTFDQVRIFFSVLMLRKRVIGDLAVLAGMRPDEIFGLTRGKVEHQYSDIEQRVDRGEIGTPRRRSGSKTNTRTKGASG